MKRKKVLLVNVADDWLTKGGDRPSLGTLYLASWLRATTTAEPSVIDLNHGGDKALEERLLTFQPDLIGISLTTPQYKEAVRVARYIKQLNKDIPIVGGGPHVTALQFVPQVPELMPIDCFDYCVVGEGETPLKMICEDGLPDQRIIRAMPNPKNKKLDWLPRPARDLVDISKYSLKIMGRSAQPVMTSMGCPFECCLAGNTIIPELFFEMSSLI